MNCQIVLCPGYNDGALLDRTLSDLISLFPAVPSVSIVPVGLSDHREGLCPLRPVDAAKAREVIETADRFGEQCLERYGTRVIYCADEFYLKAGIPIPDSEYYEDFPQIENGVGLMASFADEVREAASQVPRGAKITRRFPLRRVLQRKVLCAKWLHFCLSRAIISTNVHMPSMRWRTGSLADRSLWPAL